MKLDTRRYLFVPYIVVFFLIFSGQCSKLRVYWEFTQLTIEFISSEILPVLMWVLFRISILVILVSYLFKKRHTKVCLHVFYI